jgi:hypothetical protein
MITNEVNARGGIVIYVKDKTENIRGPTPPDSEIRAKPKASLAKEFKMPGVAGPQKSAVSKTLVNTEA